MKKIKILMGCLSLLVSACTEHTFGCAEIADPSCIVKFSSAFNPYSINKSGSIVSIQTGRLIEDQEMLEVTLAQGQGPIPAKMASGFKVERLANSIDIIFFPKDLIDFQENAANPALNPATLTVKLTSFEGATPQIFTVDVEIRNL